MAKAKGAAPEMFTIEDFIARTRAGPAIETYRRQLGYLEKYMGKPLAAATERDVVRLKERLLKMKSGYQLAAIARMFYRKAKPKREDLLEILHVPRSTGRMKADDLLTPHDVQAMIDAADAMRDKALVACLWETAARIHELLAVNLEDVKVKESPENGGRRIYVIWFGKVKERGLEHEGYVIESAVVLQRWLEAYPYPRRKGAPLFPSWGGGRLTRDGALTVVKKLARRAGIEKRVYNHLFRHSRTTWALSSGMTEAQVKALYGWSPGSTTLSRYAHLTSKDAYQSLLKTLGLEPEKVTIERLSFDDDRLKPAVPMLAPPGAKAPSAAPNVPAEVEQALVVLGNPLVRQVIDELGKLAHLDPAKVPPEGIVLTMRIGKTN